MTTRTWKNLTGEPITTQRQVRVWCPETGEEGHVSVSWELESPRYHFPQFYGPVFSVQYKYDSDGTIVEEKHTVIDADPKFA